MFFVSLGKRRNRRRFHYFSPDIFAIVLLFFDSKFFSPPKSDGKYGRARA